MRQIKPINNNSSIQLKFSVRGKRYSFNPIPGGDYSSRVDLARASVIAARIENDILAGCFDTTLERYRTAPKHALDQPKTKPQLRPNNLLQLWDLWVDTLDLSPATKADHYEMIRRMLVKAKPSLLDISWLTQANIAPATFNKRLGYLKACFKWALNESLVDDNHYDKIKTRKATKPGIKPFSIDEIRAILAGFEVVNSHYQPFTLFLLLTGVRLSEAIGLRWHNVDFDRNEVVICESLAKDRTGNGYTRVRKETKTGSIRHLTLTTQLRNLLLNIKPSQPDPNGLVFTSIEGCVIDSGNFRNLWVRVLKACDIPYRKIHTTRHTTLSHAIEQGVPLTGVAYLAGHKDTRMVMQTYGHMINRPNLPDIPI